MPTSSPTTGDLGWMVRADVAELKGPASLTTALLAQSVRALSASARWGQLPEQREVELSDHLPWLDEAALPQIEPARHAGQEENCRDHRRQEHERYLRFGRLPCQLSRFHHRVLILERGPGHRELDVGCFDP